MLDQILSRLVALVIAVISAGGYPGLALLMALISAGVPIPSELVLPFAGYLVTQGKFTLVGAATAAMLGENVGAALGYQIGYSGGRPLIERYGRFVLLDAHHVEAAERFFARWGSIAALIGRLLPVVRTFIALPAGVARMNRAKFHLYTTLGSWPWCFALAWVGMKLGDKWNTDPRLKEWFHRADVVVVAAVAVLAALFVWSKLKGAKRPRAA